MELNDREKHIASLITQLSEYANDESTTQGAIEKIVNEIRNETKENAKDEMNRVKEDAQRHLDSYRNIPSVRRKDLDAGFFRPDDVDIVMKREPKLECSLRHPGTDSMVFTRIREVKRPGKAHPTDAGIDFYVPDESAWDDDFKSKVREYSRNTSGNEVTFKEKDGKTRMFVPSGSHVAIPSGIKTIIPRGFGMMMVNKSGIATKMKLGHSACLIDSEYRDELVFCFFNHGNSKAVIEPGMKITQGLIVPIINFPLDEVVNRTYEDMGKDTNRGGGFGSTGNQ